MSKIPLTKEMPRPITVIAARRIQMRDQLWPGEADRLWHRRTEQGFSTIPRTLPLVMTLIDDLKGKGKDTSRV